MARKAWGSPSLETTTGKAVMANKKIILWKIDNIL